MPLYTLAAGAVPQISQVGTCSHPLDMVGRVSLLSRGDYDDNL
jgi:hypothetical protein